MIIDMVTSCKKRSIKTEEERISACRQWLSCCFICFPAIIKKHFERKQFCFCTNHVCTSLLISEAVLLQAVRALMQSRFVSTHACRAVISHEVAAAHQNAHIEEALFSQCVWFLIWTNTESLMLHLYRSMGNVYFSISWVFQIAFKRL